MARHLQSSSALDYLVTGTSVAEGFFAGVSLSLPTTSLLYSCQTNITLVVPSYNLMVNNLALGGVSNIVAGLTNFETLMHVSSNATYYCFQATYVALAPSTYTTRF